MIRLTVTLGLTSLLSLAGCGDDPCADLAATLIAASPGDVVSVSGCTVNGDVTVPPAVTLDGEGSTVIHGAVTLGAGSGLVDLAVQSAGPVAVSAVGAGAAVAITDVQITAEAGAGLRLSDRGAVLTRVSLTGDVDDADAVPSNPSAADYATHGLLFSNAGSPETPVVLDEVVSTRFARFGALFVDSHVVWRGGQVAEGLTTGVMAEGGTVTLEAVQLGPMRQGVQVLPAFGGVFVGGCEVTTEDLMVDGNEGFGVLHDDATASHDNLTAIGNSDAALWVQRSPSFALIGEATELRDNVLAGLVLVETDNALVRGGTFQDNTLGTRVAGTIGRVDVGDGIHAIIESGMSLEVDDVAMTGNARVGVLVDVASGNLDGVLMNVRVDGTGAQLGAVAQGPAGLIDDADWDTSVTRLGATVVNDGSLAEKLAVLEIVGPMFLPPSSM